MNARTLVTGLLSVVFVTASVVGVLLLAHGTAPSSGADEPSPEQIVSGGASAAAAAGAAFGVGEARRSAREILADWDRGRAAAYSSGRPGALRSLYTAASHSGDADVRLLRGYLSRGLRVEHLRMQVLAFRVLRRTPTRLVLQVTDRLSGAVAVQGKDRTPLPADRADDRRITMTHHGDTWLVDEVR
ncbi:hypothetical protein ASG90_16725 [Nocardioides sp. Soil797]|nr:hypothetical protein ASG90_16725 [Nocardioides sp. Soil797]